MTFKSKIVILSGIPMLSIEMKSKDLKEEVADFWKILRFRLFEKRK